MRKEKPINPEYQFWRKRIEGQIRHTIHEYPDWFCAPDKERLVRSMAKRIIGEIVAARASGNIPAMDATLQVCVAGKNEVQFKVPHSEPSVELVLLTASTNA